MESQWFCVYNVFRESLLGRQVAQVDSTDQPLKTLIKSFSLHAETGLWLNPYRGIPSVPGLAPFDLVCLDEFHRVIQEVELFSTAGYMQMDPQTASVLVLPSRTLHASRTHPGDQLVICSSEEMESRFEPRPGGNGHARFVLRQNTSANARREAAAPPEENSKHQQTAAPRMEQKMETGFQENGRTPLNIRFLRMLFADRRRASRHPEPPLVAYRWTGATPQAHCIGDISDTGLFLLTEDRWLPGTMITMTLQRANTSGDDPADSIAVQTRVVRWGSNGEGLDFVLSALPDKDPNQTWQVGGTNKKALKKFLQQLQ